MKKTLSLVLMLVFALSCMSVFAEEDNFPFTDPNVTAPGTLPICKERVTVSIGVSQNSNIIDYYTNWSVQYVQDRCNVDIEWVLFPATDADAESKLDLMIASGAELPDVITFGLNDTTALKYGQAGVYIPLNKYYDNGGAAFLNARMEEVGQPNFLNYLTSPDGNIYVLGRNNSSFGNVVAYRAWLNMDWMKALDLEEPQTIDDLLDVLRHFRDDDPNGNGIADEISMVSSAAGWAANAFAYILDMFDYYDSYGNYHVVEDGVLDVVYDRETYRDALRLAKQMVDEGLLSELSFTQDFASLAAMGASDPQIAGLLVCGSKSSFGNNFDSYTCMINVEGPDGHKAVTKTPQIPTMMCAITSSCKNPDVAFRLMESLYGDTTWETIQYLGQPDVDWKDLTDEERVEYDIGIPGNKFVLRLKPIHGQVQNSNLQQTVFPTLTTSAGIPQYIVADADGNVDMAQVLKTREQNARYDELKKSFPAECVEKIIYTAEEIDAWSELRTVILNYVNECQARFIVGDMDIENDWDTYLAELEKMNYEGLLEMDREAYNRTMGK